MVNVASNLPETAQLDAGVVDAWLQSLKGGYDAADRGLLKRACDLAMQTYADQRLESGEERLRHRLVVADILAKLNLDPETLTAAILDGITDNVEESAESLCEEFGAAVSAMVEDLARIRQVTRVSKARGGSQDKKHAENLRRLLLGVPRDVRVMLVVVADQLSNMRYAKHLPDSERSALAQDTLAIYAPLANRLGIAQIKWELEDFSLRYLEPAEYKEIAKLLDGRRLDRERFIGQVIEMLDAGFRSNGIDADISGRPKHIYSIWRKMQRKGVGFDQIFDVLAIRVLVDDIADCYAALGVVHGLWHHIPGEFDDYIATPKLNLYQSIHTAVIGPEGKPVEIQIRTHDMHHHAELGVAAHWRYKENTSHDADFERRVAWMRHWLELKDEPGSGKGALALFGGDQESAVVYVFTPQGKVIELPRGATALDFAYAIHSEVGHRCRGAKVDGRIVQLTQPLQSGQTVEILIAKNGEPSRDWLNPHAGYLHTSRARHRVRQWFKRQDYDWHLSAGRAALEKELSRLGIAEKLDLGSIAQQYNLRRGDDVLAAIGQGELSPTQVLGALGERFRPPVKKAAAKTPRPEPRGRGEVVVAGIDSVLTHVARCCKPVPHDAIIGFITQGRGVSIHRRNCPNIRRLLPNGKARIVEVRWSDQPGKAVYPVDVSIRAADRKGLLRDVSSVFTNDDLDVIGVKTYSDRKSDTAIMQFTIEISDAAQLERVLNKIAQIPDVLEVNRRT